MKSNLLKLVLTTSLFLFILNSYSYALSISCPNDQWVDCTEELWDLTIYGNATYTDYDGTHDAGVPEVVYNLNMCDIGTITRTWTATAYGHTVTCAQTIHVSATNNFGYNNITWPNNGLLLEGCSPNTDPEVLPTGYGKPTFDFTECTMIGVSHSDQIFTISPTCRKLLRKWQVMDWCTYDYNTGAGIWSFTQVIKLSDGEIPIPIVPEDIETNAYNCVDANVTIPSISVDDNTCGGDFIISNNSIYADGSGANASGVYPIGTTTIKYTVHYGCGQKKYYYTEVTVKDAKKPQPYCYQGLSIVLMPVDVNEDGAPDEGMIEVWAKDLDYDSFHDCPNHYPLRLSFSPDPEDDVKTFTCEEVGTNTVELWVTDRFGNQAYCLVQLDVQNSGNIIPDCSTDPEQTIASADGFIKSALEENVLDSEVLLRNLKPDSIYTTSIQTTINIYQDSIEDYMGNWVIYDVADTLTEEIVDIEVIYETQSLMSDRDGYFIFDSIDMHNDYQMFCSKEIDPNDYITKEDVRVLYRHISGKAPIEDPYLLIAADVNDDGIIDRDDLYLLYYFANGITTSLDIATTHLFISDHYTLEDVSEYYNNQTESSNMIYDISGDIHNMGFKMIIKGDLYNVNTAHLRTNSDDEDILSFLESPKRPMIISPNPFIDELEINLVHTPTTEVNIRLYDAQGKIVLNEIVEPNQFISIKTNDKFNPGVYYYTIKYDSSNQSGKLIKL